MFFTIKLNLNPGDKFTNLEVSDNYYSESFNNRIQYISNSIDDENILFSDDSCFIFASYQSHTVNKNDFINKIYQHYKRGRLADLPKTLNGKFFIIIFDYITNQINCFSDYFGFLPIYYIKKNSDIYFSCDLSFLLRANIVEKEINKKKVADFIELVPSTTKETFYENIFKIVPRKIYQFNMDSTISKPYDEFLDKSKKSLDISYQADAIKERLTKIVNNHFLNNEKVGILFSGGLDSSSIASVVKKKYQDKLYLYSGTYDQVDKKYQIKIDEKKFKREIYNLGFKNINELDVSRHSTLSNIDEFLLIFREPFFFPNLGLIKSLYEESSNHNISLILNGMDGDSVASYGYESITYYFFRFKFRKLYKEISKISLLSNLKKRSVFKLLLIKPIFAYLKDFVEIVFNIRRPRSNLINKKFYQKNFKKKLHHPFNFFWHPSSYHDYVMNDNLRYESIEKHSLLARHLDITPAYPFYDSELVKLFVNADINHKLKDGVSRYLLRFSLKNKLPFNNRNRLSKSNLGYGFCYQLRYVDKDFINNSIFNPSKKIQEFYNYNKIRDIWSSFLDNPFSEEGMELSKDIYTFCILNEWLKKEFN